jgi:GGDEF domain-containing protein
VGTDTLQHLVPLINRRFQSFAEATDAALGVLAGALPGTIVVGQIEPEGNSCRVLDARGDGGPGVDRGAMLPLAVPAGNGNGNGTGAHSRALRDGTNDQLDPEFLRSLGFAGSLSLPVELSDGNVVGVLCAVAPDDGLYRHEHVIILGLAARLLSYEWERVRSRAELRQLRQRAADGASADPETGLPNRAAFGDLLDREWRLAKRGTVNSTVVALRIEVDASEPELEASHTLLALKDAAEVLAGAVRTTDHVGRLDELTLGVVMIGSEDPAGVAALVGRYEQALHRHTRGRPFEISLSVGFQTLDQAASFEAALEVAEQGARS